MLRLFAFNQQRVSLEYRARVRVRHTPKVVLRHGVNDVLPLFDPLPAVDVEDLVVCFAIPDTREALV